MKTTNKILYQAFKPKIGSIILILILILLMVGFESLTPYPFKVLIDNVLGNTPLDPNSLQGHIFSFINSRESLGFFIILIYGLSIIFQNIAEYWTNLLNRKLSNSIIQNFAQRVFEALQTVGISFYNEKEIGDYIYRLSYDVSAIGDMLEFGILPLITNIFYVSITVTILFIINVKLALVSLIITPLLALLLYIFNSQIGIATSRSEKNNSSLFSFIQQSLSQMKIIQAFNQQHRFSEKFKELEHNSLEGEQEMDQLDYLQELLVGVIIALGYSTVIVYGMKLVFNGELSTGLLIAFMLYIDNLIYPLLAFINAASSFREDFTKISRMNDFFISRFQIKDSGGIYELPNSSIVFNDVSVENNQGALVLKNASFTIPEGKITVIIGPSGSGKTTIISLLLRFIGPSKGSVLVGGHEIDQYGLRSLREAIAYVPQEVVLFDDTIFNNIAFSGINDKHAVHSAGKLANADFINNKEGGYEYNVGTEGQKLSGGQRQRILIARAFLKTQSKIVIMDEPFSSLDVKTRQELTKNINKFAKGRTTIIVSNVLDVIDQADNVILVNNGEVSEVKDKSKFLTEKSLSSLIMRI